MYARQELRVSCKLEPAHIDRVWDKGLAVPAGVKV